MTAMNIVNAIRIFVIIGGCIVLLYGLIVLPKFRPFPQFAFTTGLLSLVLAASANEYYDLGKEFDFALVASVCGIIFTGLGLILIRK
jgi:hypothetical protein